MIAVEQFQMYYNKFLYSHSGFTAVELKTQLCFLRMYTKQYLSRMKVIHLAWFKLIKSAFVAFCSMTS